MTPGETLEWRISTEPVDYVDAVAAMDERVAGIRSGAAPELVWLLEHPALYTAGTSAAASDLLAPGGLPVHASGRGGQYTYHGPGQRVAYVQLDLDRRGRDIRAHVHRLEAWAIAALARFGVHGERREGRVGVWVDRPGGEAKIAAIGVRVRRWVTLHGLAINVAPDLAAFAGIVPCGLRGFGVTSLADLGVDVAMAQMDDALRQSFAPAFDAQPMRRAG